MISIASSRSEPVLEEEELLSMIGPNKIQYDIIGNDEIEIQIQIEIEM